jgi:site-specific DNA-methyltransferase (adenine-specific)
VVAGWSLWTTKDQGVKLTPFYDQDGITIYHGDCAQVLPFLDPVDLLLTDPPYGIGIAANPVRQKHEKSDWDNSAPAMYIINHAISKAGKAIIWGGNYFNLRPTRKFLVWDKRQPEDFSLAMAEQAWCSFDGNAKIFAKRVVGYEKDHPTQKPESLMAWCIEQAGDGVATILDPFMGSGTTLVAAKNLGKRAIGIERELKYCEIAVRRLAQQTLFQAT